MDKYICPRCGGQEFLAKAAVTQEWKINTNGEFTGTADECADITQAPGENDTWTCAGCGYAAAGREFKKQNKQPARNTVSTAETLLCAMPANIRYWCNACGELFDPETKEDLPPEKLPGPLKKAWNELWSDSYGEFCYLMEYNGDYFISLERGFERINTALSAKTAAPAHITSWFADIVDSMRPTQADTLSGYGARFMARPDDIENGIAELALLIPAETSQHDFLECLGIFKDTLACTPPLIISITEREPWIPVDERQPEYDTPVQVSWYDEESRTHKCGKTAILNEEGWKFKKGEAPEQGGYVTAWKPESRPYIPKRPPKPKGYDTVEKTLRKTFPHAKNWKTDDTDRFIRELLKNLEKERKV